MMKVVVKLVCFIFALLPVLVSANTSCKMVRGASHDASFDDVYFHYAKQSVPYVKSSGPSNQKVFAAWFDNCGIPTIDVYYFANQTDQSWNHRIKAPMTSAGVGVHLNYEGMLIISRLVSGSDFGEILYFDQSGRELWRGKKLESWGAFTRGPKISAVLAKQLKGKRVLSVGLEGNFRWLKASMLGESAFLALGTKLVILAHTTEKKKLKREEYRVHMDSRYFINGGL